MKKIVIIIAVALSAVSLPALEIYWADIIVVNNNLPIPLTDAEKSVSGAMKNAILSADKNAFLDIKDLKSILIYSGEPVKSLLDAQEMCEALSVEYLFYGYFIKEESYYDAELYFYSRKDKAHKKVFYARSEYSDLTGMVEELGLKVAKYFYALYNVEVETGKPPASFDGLFLQTGAGWWFPVGEWSNLLTGIFDLHAGFGIIPGRPFYNKRDTTLFARYSIELLYGFAINAPAIQETYFHSFDISIPAHLCLLLGNELFYIGAGPTAQLDMGVQIRMFEDSILNLTTGFGAFLDVGFEYWFGKDRTICIGAQDRYSFIFYRNFFMKNQLNIYGTFRFPFDKKTEAPGKGE